jgi:hypothetical protein
MKTRLKKVVVFLKVPVTIYANPMHVGAKSSCIREAKRRIANLRELWLGSRTHFGQAVILRVPKQYPVEDMRKWLQLEANKQVTLECKAIAAKDLVAASHHSGLRQGYQSSLVKLLQPNKGDKNGKS